MAIVISDDVVLATDELSAGITGNNPRIGWHNVVTEDNVTADEEDADFPAVNVGNPITSMKWKGETAGVQTITVDLGVAVEVNYFGISGHNFGSDATNIKLQKSTNGSAWTDVTPARVLPNDTSYMEEFADANTRYYRLHLTPNSLVPQLAVLYIGRVLRMQRRIYVGHKPAILNRQTTISSGVSENGQFLGRVKLRQMLRGSADFKNITPVWYRARFDPFVVGAEEAPFFFAWRPESYPNDVGFMWLDGDPEATNELPNGLMSIHMSMSGMR